MKIFMLIFSYIVPFYKPFLWPLLWYVFPLTYMLHLQKRCLPFYLSATISIGHIAPLALALYDMAAGPIALKIIAPFAIIIYIALFPLAFFTAFLALQKYCTTKIQRIILWTIIIWLYCVIIDQYCLWPFGKCEGIIFMNPLLPIASSPWMLWPLRYVSLNVLLFLFFCFCNSLLIIGYRNWLLLSCIYVGCSFLCYAPKAPPEWLSTIGRLAIQIPASIGPRGAIFIEYEIDLLLSMYPDLKTIIIPESGWYGTDIQNTDILCKKAENFLIGSFFENQIACFNSLYHFKNGTLHSRTDKNHTVPLTEHRIFPGMINDLFFAHSKPICPSKQLRLPIDIMLDLKLVPYICSELFCNYMPIDSFKDPILAIANDTWFCKHMRLLMALAAQLRSLQWQRQILYISYHSAQFFDPTGSSQSLITQ